MSSSLSKLVDNLSKGIHNNKCSDCKSNLDYIKTINEKLILECYNCKQRYRKKFDKELIKDLLVHMNFVIMTLINLYYC